MAQKGKDFGSESFPNPLICDISRLWPRFLRNEHPGLEPIWLIGFLIDYRVGYLHNRLGRCSYWL